MKANWTRKCRGGFTLAELLLAAFILATLSTAAIVGTVRIADYINKGGEQLDADGYCWDVAWRLFNVDPDELCAHLVEKVDGRLWVEEDSGVRGYPVPKKALPAAFFAPNGASTADYPEPRCYVTVSNVLTAAQVANGVGADGIYICVNLTWGARDSRSALNGDGDATNEVLRTGGTLARDYRHPVVLYRSRNPRCKEEGK